MRIALEHRPAALPQLLEVVTPRTNAATITPAENLLAAIALDEPFALEIAATATARWFLVRAGGPAMRRHLAEQLGAAYPQATLRPLDLAAHPGLDPARLGPDERAAACALVLARDACLPLRTFGDAEVAADRSAQADPVLGLLAALGNLPPGWRALSQLVLRPAPEDWCRPYLRLALEHPLARERAGGERGPSLWPVLAAGGLLAAGVAAVQAYAWYLDGAWPELALLGGGLAVGAPGLLWLGRRLGRRALDDPRLVQEKVSRGAFVAQLRLLLVGPADAPAGELAARLRGLAAAYRQYSLAAGNGLVPRPLRLSGRDPRAPAFLPPGSTTAVLNTRELAGLWHPPQMGADVPFVERTAARQRLPLPCTVARGCPIGRSSHQGHVVPVALPEDLLRRHLLLVAKTRRGKSSLMLRLAQHLMAERGPAGRPALVVVDPHRDLAEAVLGCVPPERRGDVVYLDVAERNRPFGLNLIDTGLGWDRDKAVEDALTIFEREFEGFWGPRMADAFGYALKTLYEVNESLCDEHADGRASQHTVLDVPTVLADAAFRRTLLRRVADPVVRAWWATYVDGLTRNQLMEIINPVQTKVQKFAGSRIARDVVGQPASTIDPLAWVREGRIVVVNTAKGLVGEDTAAMIGATLLNLVGMAIAAQAELPPARRRQVALLVDEFHVIPAADYEAVLSELSKYGASLILATQSLARLDALDRQHQRALRGTVFANIDGLFAFNTSAEDARYLVPELGPEVEEEDLVGLGEHRCYARVSARGERLPVFSVELDPPPPSDPALRAELAAASAERYGRDAGLVEADQRRAQERVALGHPQPVRPAQAEAGGPGPAEGKGASRTPARSEHRNNPARAASPEKLQTPPDGLRQTSFLEDAADGAAPAGSGDTPADAPDGSGGAAS